MKKYSIESSLKGAGFAMMVGGAIAIIYGIVTFISSLAATAVQDLFFASACLSIACGVIAIAAGYAAESKSQEEPKVYVVWGIVVMALAIGGSALGAIAGSLSVVNLVLGVFIPALYIMSASDNKTEVVYVGSKA